MSIRALSMSLVLQKTAQRTDLSVMTVVARAKIALQINNANHLSPAKKVCVPKQKVKCMKCAQPPTVILLFPYAISPVVIALMAAATLAAAAEQYVITMAAAETASPTLNAQATKVANRDYAFPK